MPEDVAGGSQVGGGRRRLLVVADRGYHQLRVEGRTPSVERLVDVVCDRFEVRLEVGGQVSGVDIRVRFALEVEDGAKGACERCRPASTSPAGRIRVVVGAGAVAVGGVVAAGRVHRPCRLLHSPQQIFEQRVTFAGGVRRVPVGVRRRRRPVVRVAAAQRLRRLVPSGDVHDGERHTRPGHDETGRRGPRRIVERRRVHDRRAVSARHVAGRFPQTAPLVHAARFGVREQPAVLFAAGVVGRVAQHRRAVRVGATRVRLAVHGDDVADRRLMFPRGQRRRRCRRPLGEPDTNPDRSGHVDVERRSGRRFGAGPVPGGDLRPRPVGAACLHPQVRVDVGEERPADPDGAAAGLGCRHRLALQMAVWGRVGDVGDLHRRKVDRERLRVAGVRGAARPPVDDLPVIRGGVVAVEIPAVRAVILPTEQRVAGHRREHVRLRATRRRSAAAVVGDICRRGRSEVGE